MSGQNIYKVELLIGLDKDRAMSEQIYNELLEEDEGNYVTSDAQLRYNIEHAEEGLGIQIFPIDDNWYLVVTDRIDQFLKFIHDCQFDYSDVIKISGTNI